MSTQQPIASRLLLKVTSAKLMLGFFMSAVSTIALFQSLMTDAIWAQFNGALFVAYGVANVWQKAKEQ